MASSGRRVIFFALTLFLKDYILVFGAVVNEVVQSQDTLVKKQADVNFQPRNDKFADNGQGGVGAGNLPQSQLQDILKQGRMNGPGSMGGSRTKELPVKAVGGASNVRTQRRQQTGGGRGRKSNFKLSETPECAEDVRQRCSDKTYRNNFAIMDCLQQDAETADDLSNTCNNFLWEYKRNLTRDDRFEYAADEVCVNELKEIPECAQIKKGNGQIIPCLVDHLENITGNCRTYLSKMARIVFSDYRLVFHFVEECKEDIQQLKCGRITSPQDEKLHEKTTIGNVLSKAFVKKSAKSVHSQGYTLSCLAEKKGSLKKECKKQVLRVNELQSDDYHLDRQLYYACRGDREQFCANVASGQGRVIECLFKHKFERSMSDECRQKLTIRQQIIAEDVKAEKTFYQACRTDIASNKCFSMGQDNLGEDTRRASVLLCLESLNKRDVPLAPECLGEMVELRKTLMQDYKINPEIVANCEEEIRSCGGGLERGGKTIHCLMDLARAKKKKKHMDLPRMSAQCKRAMESLVKEADVGSDYRMDKNLATACQDVVNIACRDIQPGDARVMNCLMDKLDSDHMTDDCEEKLMEIQYFIVRDFRLDNSLYKHCRMDATTLCNAPKNWVEQNTNVDMGPLVMPCLYRHMKDHSDSSRQVSRVCKHEIKRAMRMRAKRAELDPEIEANCVIDLGKFCSDGESEKIKKGEEVACLQDNYDDLSDDCQEVVANMTEDQELYLELDNVLMRSCMPMIKKFCEEEMDEDTEADDVMECLIEHKHHAEMDDKCAAGVEHHQIISLKDFRFNHKFKEACKESVMTFCRNRKTKYEVISCLSEHVRNDTVKQKKHRIAKPCRKQLRFEVLNRGENIELDPELKKACAEDIRTVCSNIEHENGKITECLKTHPKRLSPKCHKKIFLREKEDVLIGDYKLQQACKKMIKQYCGMAKDTGILQCLAKNKGKPDFDEKCRTIVIRRQVIQNQDYRLNPNLRKSCKMDIPKFCKNIISKEKNDEELEGKVITCLRKQFLIDRLSRECNGVIRELIKESALNYLEDPALANACETDIQNICGDTHNSAVAMQNQVLVRDDGKGQVIECLKKAFMSKLINGEACKKEIARINEEAHIDINVDPLLHTACQQDLHRHCGHVNPGNGRQMNCLLIELEDRPNGLTLDCRKLITSRKDLWEYSVRVAPVEGLQEIYEQINVSPAKTYILGVLCAIVGIIFIIGISCGRVTKRMAKGDKGR